MKRIIIFANGELSDLGFYHRQIKEDDYIICADGGTNHALALGITPHAVVGDLDSLDSDTCQILQQAHTEFKIYPSNKAKSDLELAVSLAASLKPEEIIIFGALGKRLDHVFANLMLITLPLNCGIKTKILDEDQEIQIVGEELELTGEVGDIVSLFPLTAEVKAVVTEGLKYSLNGETLYFASTRGLSNELSAPEAKIKTAEGFLLVIKVKKRRIL